MIKISDFQSKDVINITNGKRLGRISDLELDLTQGRVKALVIPGSGRLLGFLSSGSDIVIPWNQIVKIGVDVILVRVEEKASVDPEYTYDEVPYRRELPSGKGK
ncbi:Sporulation protein, YlmC/YmxH family [[Clostridium] ultunense Esp]|uniref:YlmC/YmxH family sporulation protein n=1 Tax=Thermicanus aegyptius TaxID=94009 RepID=UPI0002B6F50B|nr:YlmC/YmxH family sporulation protein [Thermicanus aegyptius]CCQ92910.1 Sporulation protein, YlmC/YmxH family [[Clostridium] ultunense Esp]